MIDTTEFQQRRNNVLAALDGAIGLVLAGDGAPPLSGMWKPESHFAYLTGLHDEPGAAVLFDGRNPDPKRRCILFLKPRNPEAEAWDGYRDPLTALLRQRTGFEAVQRTTLLPRTLTTSTRQRKRLACLHAFSVYEAPVSPDLTIFRKVTERVPGVSTEDHTDLIPRLRSIKSPNEIALMRKAGQATAAGYAKARTIVRPGATERNVQRALENGWAEAGATGIAYNPIVGSGLRSTVLHYNANTGELAAGDLLLIDAACSVEGYCADVTRTWPVSGKFTPRQQEVYGVVLRALRAATQAVGPGVWMNEVDEAARAIIRAAGFEDFFIHGIGHQLGLEVHDSTPDGPLRPGMVLTIEPGIYIPAENIGIRLEDDVLVTATGHENLTAAIPMEPLP